MYTKIEKCRICGNKNLVCVLDLGVQMLTGVFPHKIDNDITKGPLRLVKCLGENTCGLLQLEHSYSLDEMYGENYGYRSGLNLSMVSHLHEKVKKIHETINIITGDLIIDIGSNDSTTLQAYSDKGLLLVGVDPTGVKFKDYYPDHIKLIPDFFSANLIKAKFPGKKAKVVTSFAMFYDLEDPTAFMQQVYDVLEDGGIWVFEQSYMPTMLETNSYDTVCHEHLEFYSLHQIKWMADKVGFKILEVELNDVNGGSFSIIVSKSSNSKTEPAIQEVLNKEIELGLHTLDPYLAFAKRIEGTRNDLVSFVKNANKNGKLVVALGASTKGNVLLQYCGFTEKDIQFVGEVNADKFGAYTPGTWIPIIPEKELLDKNPDYLIILPWHFQNFFKVNSKFAKRNLLLPLPSVRPLI